ncbi:MAG: hypothetical protein MZU95_01305 [Desulfomicrobium escambiense]|nr:hypothetical protein [Desulfomicrobium escambiense]
MQYYDRDAKPHFIGAYEDNDPYEAAAVHRELQQRRRRVLGVLGHRLDADRSVERGVQAGRELHRLCADALGARGSRERSRGKTGRRREARRDANPAAESPSPGPLTETRDVTTTEPTSRVRRRRGAGRPHEGQPRPDARPSSARSSSARSAVIEQVMLTLFVGGNSLIVGVPGLAKTLLITHGGGRARPEVRAHPVHARPDAVRHHRHRHHPGRSRRPASATWCSRRGPCSRTSCWPTRSTARRRRRSRRCSRRCRSTASRSRAAPTRSTSRSTSSPRRTRSSSRARYPLPEAQLDRFMFHIVIDHPPEDEELEVLRTTTAVQDASVERAVTGAEILVAFQRLVRRVPVSEPVMAYALCAGAREPPPRRPARWTSSRSGCPTAPACARRSTSILGAKARAVDARPLPRERSRTCGRWRTP